MYFIFRYQNLNYIYDSSLFSVSHFSFALRAAVSGVWFSRFLCYRPFAMVGFGQARCIQQRIFLWIWSHQNRHHGNTLFCREVTSYSRLLDVKTSPRNSILNLDTFRYMHLSQLKLCTRKMELALEVKFHLDFHWVTELELHVQGDERWPMEVTSNTYFRGITKSPFWILNCSSGIIDSRLEHFSQQITPRFCSARIWPTGDTGRKRAGW